MFNHSPDNTLATGLDYELVDLAGFGTPADEAVAMKNQFGAPRASPEGTAGSMPKHLPLVIVGYDQQRVLQALRERRADTGLADTALRPIAVVGLNRGDVQPSLEALADVVVGPRPSVDTVRDMRETLTSLATQAADLTADHGDRALLLLQYLGIRERYCIEPVVDPGAVFAYRYPLAESLLSASSTQALDILEDLAEYQLLASKVVDRLFLCPHCGGYRVPVKELCDKCHSPDIAVQNSIHHFRCGYVGPESEFMIDGRLRCPKCRADLRHVGVEYNHPGRVVTCHACNHWAAEPLLQAWCVDCNRYLPPEQLRSLRISCFTITSRGMRAARAGRWNPNEAQAVSSAGNSGANLAALASVERKRAVARTILRVASANQWKVAAYRVDFDVPPAAADAALQSADKQAEFDQCVTRYLGPQALTAPLGEKGVLVLNPGTHRDGRSAAAALARRIAKTLHCRATVSALAASAAAELLAAAG